MRAMYHIRHRVHRWDRHSTLQSREGEGGNYCTARSCVVPKISTPFITFPHCTRERAMFARVPLCTATERFSRGGVYKIDWM
jgi:hypothetical protein